ncbi:MAG: hypothetical protein NZ920_01065 [Aigarchaeota archaeon]|nr:hypothetical protein [Aigarchaeota archaeon]MDW8093031.1 hypothetical protein [Nitrososphaerota archaeon]
MDAIVEGDYVYVNGVGYMAVKGVSHPPGSVIAVPRYDEDFKGIDGLSEGYVLLKERAPHVLRFDDHAGQVLPIFNTSEVTKVIRAGEWWSVVDRRDRVVQRAIELIDLLTESYSISREAVGLSGSLLLRRQHEGSDIDLVFYSMKESFKVLDALSSLRSRGLLRPVSDKEPGDLLEKRRPSPYDLSVWVRHESRKLLYGIFHDRPYSAKIVPLPDEYWERYGSRAWRSMGQVKVEAVVKDDTYAAFTPNRHIVEVTRVIEGRSEAMEATEVISFRSRFAEQAKSGEEVLVSGRLEMDLRSSDIRIFVGNVRDDGIMVKSLLTRK